MKKPDFKFDINKTKDCYSFKYKSKDWGETFLDVEVLVEQYKNNQDDTYTWDFLVNGYTFGSGIDFGKFNAKAKKDMKRSIKEKLRVLLNNIDKI
jgi:hypothetical protein